LEPVRHYKARHGSVMLVFDAIERAIDEIEGKRPAGLADAVSA
jgi:NifU-like protein involved in Fe-S cluster formation